MAKILVVEDNAVNRTLMRSILVANGFEYIEAENGAEGVKAARLHRPDLILMDLQMPVMNGCEAAQILKEDPQTGQIPIIAVSAFPLDPDERKFLPVRFDHHIAKPFLAAEVKTIREFLPAAEVDAEEANPGLKRCGGRET